MGQLSWGNNLIVPIRVKFLLLIIEQKKFYPPDTTRPEVDKHIVKKVPVEELHSETGTICVGI